MWSGLIRDFYVPRLEAENTALRAGQPFDFDNWEKTWLAAKGTTPAEPFPDPVESARQLVQAAKVWQPPAISGLQSPFEWKSGQIGQEWVTQEWDITPKITKAGNVRALFLYTAGAHRLDLSLVELLQDGQVVAHDEHNGTTGLGNRDNTYLLTLPTFQAGAKYTLRARVRADGGNDSNGDIFILTK